MNLPICRTGVTIYICVLFTSTLDIAVNSQVSTVSPTSTITGSTTPSTSRCSSTQFECFVNGSNYGQNGTPCIPQSWRCDGEPDCRAEEDEQDCCDPVEFECHESLTVVRRCIPLSHQCDHTQDCYNAEDEKNCSHPACTSDQFRCVDNGQCVDSSWKCNGIVDCGDESDEDEKICGGIKCPAGQIACFSHCINANLACNGQADCGNLPNGTVDNSDEALCGIDECQTNKGGCSHGCTNLLLGFKCTCPSGYKLGDDKLTCIDINECEEFPRGCTQICSNTEGSYTCSCVDGYTLKGNRCVRNDNIEPTLIFANRYYIRNMSLNGTYYDDVLSLIEHTHVCDFDSKTGHVYYADASTREMRRIKVIPKGEPEILIWHDLPLTEGIAVDWVNKKVYWTDSTKKAVFVAETNGSHVHTLKKGVTTRPRAIIVHPKVGYLLWTDWSINPFIAKMGMDGSGFMKVVESGLFWPNALAVDPHIDKFWWADAQLDRIECANFDGSSRQVILKDLPHVYSLTLFDSVMYWADWNTKKIERANCFSGENRTQIRETLNQPYDIHIYHPALQPSYPNPCGTNNGGCSHLCLIGPATTPGGSTVAVCACPDHFKLEADGKTCQANCSSAQFECGRDDHRCIPRSWVCDGQGDCKGGDDELQNCTKRVCPPGLHQCSDNSCIYPVDLCDGYPDCDDDEAEEFCKGRACLPNEFRCNTGKCIHESWVCDEEADCNDGEDEAACSQRNCTELEFSCDNGKCIPKHYYCDFDDDCGDRSDEPRDICRNIPCKAGWGRCKTNYRCIPDILRCDGSDDCRDNSDEDPEKCPKCDSEGDFTCANGQCIPLRWKCDGEPDCDDASDEKETICEEEARSCSSVEFTCENKRCIRSTYKCDHDNDCGDMSDEKNELCGTHECPTGGDYFQCKSGHCISQMYRCDQDKDCIDASDEENCPTIFPNGRFCLNNQFDCGNGVCISPTWKCDGEDDCGNGNDEKLEVCRDINCDTSIRWRCPNGRCIYRYQLCDHKDNCGDAGDENNFTICSQSTRCNPFEFKCANQKCISGNDVCDYVDDCGDLSDEIGCHKHNRSSSCGQKNGGCSQLCTTIIPKNSNYTGHICHCEKGYAPDPENKTNCIDVDECKTWGMANCSQRCVNTKGGYDCFCEKGFTRQVTKTAGNETVTHCLPGSATKGRILLSLEGTVRQLDLSQHIKTDAVKSEGKVYKIALDIEKKRLFWTDPYARMVYRAELPEIDYTAPPDPILDSDSNLHFPDGIAFDWVTRNLYVTDRNKGSIYVMKEDGRYKKTLIDSPLRNPMSIALNPKRGLMYWVDSFNGKVEMASMDGSNARSFYANTDSAPSSVAVDHFMDGRVFWCDTKHNLIRSANHDGSGLQIVISHGLQAPQSLDILHDNLYWISAATGRVAKMDKFGRGINVTLEDTLQVYPRDIKVFHPLRHPKLRNPCDSLNCWPLCLLIPGGATCVCPDGSSQVNSTHCDSERLPERPLPDSCKCQNGGRCLVDVAGKKTCRCKPGHHGNQCQFLVPSPPERIEGTHVSVAAVLVPIFVIFLIGFGVITLLFFLRQRGYLSQKTGKGEFRPGPPGPSLNGAPPPDGGVVNPNYSEPIRVEYDAAADATRFSNPMYDKMNPSETPVQSSVTMNNEEPLADNGYTSLQDITVHENKA